ncbi:O-antigen ligase family protein [Oceanicaulis alexandrii]|uniref:O-antigen ligase family protein n=1 Tax=Oceanicaulis alexandrii TaxID=153233 RepID=UPI0003B35AEA|nr:O-antigen ligase family protein [Oceanicaulis alexandrii]
MPSSLWTAGPILLIIGLAALAQGADQPSSALLFSALLSAGCALILVSPGARISVLGAVWIVGGVGLFLIGALKGWASTGAGEYASLLAGGGVFLAARNAALKREAAQAIVLILTGMGALIGFAAFIDFFIAPRTLFGFELPTNIRRLSTPFLSANTAATFYGIFALLALAFITASLKRGGRFDSKVQRLALPVGSLLTCATCLFLSGSRAGISLFMITALSFLAWDRVAAWRSSFSKRSEQNLIPTRTGPWGLITGPGAFIVLGLVLFGVSGGLYAERIEQGGLLLADNPRGVMFAKYIQAIWLSPLWGAGLGGFAFVNDFIATAPDARTIMYQNAAHNVAFQWLLQTGLPASLLALALTGALLRRILRGLSTRRSQRSLLRACFIIAVFVFAHGMVDYALEIPAVFWLFSFILGLGVGVADGGRSKRNQGAPSLALKAGVTLALVACASFSLYAGVDRNSALGIASSSDEAFSTKVSSEADLKGSATRLEAIGDRALRLDAPDLALARAAFRSSLDVEPRSAKTWAKLAYVNYAIIPIIAGETEEALRQSYYLMPYADRRFIEWRLGFVASAWTSMPADLRDAAEREARTLPVRAEARWRRRVGLPD